MPNADTIRQFHLAHRMDSYVRTRGCRSPATRIAFSPGFGVVARVRRLLNLIVRHLCRDMKIVAKTTNDLYPDLIAPGGLANALQSALREIGSALTVSELDKGINFVVYARVESGSRRVRWPRNGSSARGRPGCGGIMWRR
jgi:hypothetical protein